MFSDVGIGTSIIQKDEGDESAFLNTAWTVQVIRGFVIWVGLCILAYPVSVFYSEPELLSMIPVVGLSAIISSFNSTKLFTAQRNLKIARVSQIEVGSFAIGLMFSITFAWLHQSVWALVWGNLITVTLKLVASHVALPGIDNRFTWDPHALKHLRGFGRWILLSSALTFLSSEGARLAIGAVFDMRQVAMFTLASTMNLMFWQAMQQMAASVFFPAYAEVHRVSPEKLTKMLLRARLTIVLPSWILAVGFILFGSQIMGALYDVRYLKSGVMLEQLAVGSLVACIWGSYSGVLLALGKVATSTVTTLIFIVCQFAGMYIGYRLGGEAGFVMGIAVASWVAYPAHAYILAKNGLWQPKLDLSFLAASVMILVLAWPSLIPH